MPTSDFSYNKRMPSLHLFQRKTVIAGDDLQPAALITILVRIIQIFALIVSISIHVSRELHRFLALRQSTSDEQRYEYFFGGKNVYPESTICNSAHYFPLLLVIYLSFSTIQATVSIFIERRVFILSSVGTPIESYKRNPILSKILQRHYIWGHVMGNIILLILGLVCCFGYAHIYYTCRESIQRQLVSTQLQVRSQTERDHLFLSQSLDPMDYINSSLHIPDRTFYSRRSLSFKSRWWPSAWWIPLILLLLSQGAELLLTSIRVVGLLLKEKVQPFLPNTIDMESSELQSIHHSNHALVEAMWDQRIRAFFQCAARATCFLFGGKELVRNMAGDYGDIARTLADFFEYGEVLDLTPTDLAVAFMMLQRVQRQRVLEARKGVVDGSRVANSVRADWSIRTNAGSLNDDATRLSTPSEAHSSSASLSKLADISEELNVTKDYETISSMLNSPVSRSNVADARSSPLTMASLKMLTEDRRDSHHWYETEQRRVLSRNDERDRYALAEGARFSRFALGIYTWILYIYVKPVTGLVDLYFQGCKDACCRKRSARPNSRDRDEREEASPSDSLRGDTALIEGENCCHMHTNALLRHVGLDRCDLLYANFKNKYNQMPYCVILDHSWQSVVVTIRGTLSLEDCVVDVLLEPEPLDVIGRELGFNGDSEYCHGGVLACAKFVYSDLEHNNILSDLLTGKNARYPNYKLRFVGHSLGAGCATLLGYFYRRKYPSLRVLSFSPPGGFMTWRMAIECKDFVTSFVLDTELVPRLSIDSMEHLRSEVLELFGRIRVTKFEVVRSFVTSGVFCDKDEYNDGLFLEHKNRQMLHPPGFLDESADFFDRINEFKAIQTRRKLMRGDIRAIRLYPPGRLIHFVRTGERNSCSHGIERCLCCMSNAGYEYTPIWLENDDLNEIVISPTMFTDHFPNRVCLEIEEVAKEFGIDTTNGI